MGIHFPSFHPVLHLFMDKLTKLKLGNLLIISVVRFLCAWSYSITDYCISIKVLTLLYFLRVPLCLASCLPLYTFLTESDLLQSLLILLTHYRYGELSPSTFPGKLIGGLCALCGIFILTLPIPIVVNRQTKIEIKYYFSIKYFLSFASYYKNRLWRNEVKLKAQSVWPLTE